MVHYASSTTKQTTSTKLRSRRELMNIGPRARPTLRRSSVSLGRMYAQFTSSSPRSLAPHRSCEPARMQPGKSPPDEPRYTTRPSPSSYTDIVTRDEEDPHFHRRPPARAS